MGNSQGDQPPTEAQLSAYDQSYLAGARLAGALASGWQPPPQPTSIALAPGEHVYANAPIRILQHSEETVTYSQGGLFVFGNPWLTVASVAGSMAYNSRQKRRAAAEAAAQWRPFDDGHAFLTSCRIAVMGRLAWSDIYYSTLRYCTPDADGIMVMVSGQAPLKLLIWPPHWHCTLLRFLAYGEITRPEIPPHLRPYLPEPIAIDQAPPPALE